MNNLTEIVEYYRANIGPKSGPENGCAINQLKTLEAKYDCKLPLIYRDFLLWNGQEENGPFALNKFTFDNIVPNTTSLRGILKEENASHYLGDSYIAFCQIETVRNVVYKKWIMGWFEFPAEEDPECFWFIPEQPGEPPTIKKRRFSEIVLHQMKRHVYFLKPLTGKIIIRKKGIWEKLTDKLKGND